MKAIFLTLILAFSFLSAESQEGFKVIVLGCSGGPLESNVSGYLIAPKGSNEFVALDAGTLLNGIYEAEKNQSFQDLPKDPSSPFRKEVEILRRHVKAYLISHAHLDHIAGLVLNSTEDLPKSIFAIDSVVDFLRDYIFNGKIWPNFGSEGNEPRIKQYTYQRLELGKKIPISAEMEMEPYLLSHPDGYESTAFLIKASEAYAAYFGDTVPDCLSSKKQMQTVWKRLAPLVREKKLKGIFLECSYLDKPDHQLFGHLDAKHMIKELRHFADFVDPLNPQNALEGLKVFVIHMKNPLLEKGDYQREIEEVIKFHNDLGIEFFFPSQGERIDL